MEDDVKVDKFVEHFETFVTATYDARELSERDRDYRDHKQWTDEQVNKLRERGQAPIVINRIAPKVDYMLGLERQSRSDPRAFPRTMKHQQDAEVVTDALRYVADNTDFDSVASETFENMIVEGYGACIKEVRQEGNEFSIVIKNVPWNRFYYDPFSRRKDFKDAAYLGVVAWLNADEAKRLYPEKSEEIEHALSDQSDYADGDTFEDKPNWIDRKRKRLRVCQEYYLDDGVWHTCHYMKETFLMSPRPSPFLDERGDPDCPIEAQSTYVDRENNRYGLVRALVDVQDEINHRRSKALHLLSQRQTLAEQGAVNDVHEMKRELTKPNGHIDVNQGFRFEILPTNDMANGQFNLLAEAKNEIDAIGANAALAGKDGRSLSGRALQARQQGGLTELNMMLDSHRKWKKRVFRQMWAGVKQFWDEEKWIRVTDNANKFKFSGLNIPVTRIEAMLQQRTGMDIVDVRQNFQNEIMQAIQQDPRFAEVVGVANNVTELDVDIILDESPDTVALQQEQFEVLAELAKAYGPQFVPFEALLRLSAIHNKEEIMSLLKPDPEQQMQMQAEQQKQQALQDQANQLMQAKTVADIRNINAKASKEEQEAMQKQVETMLIQSGQQPVNISI